MLRDLLKKAGLRPFDVLRKKEQEFRELKITPETADEKVIELIVKHPNLLQRPIVEVGKKAIIARPIEKALALVAEARA
jgi:arsenate reductase